MADGGPNKGDSAFRMAPGNDHWPEMTYGGALSFLRRPYSRTLTGVDAVVSGVPYDGAVTNRSGCRLGPRAIRAASTLLAELPAFPFGFWPFDTLNVVDWGDCYLDPHHPETIAASIEAHADHILASGATMITLGGDHFISYPLLKAHARRHGPLALIQVDAHCDTWTDDGRQLDHGTMFARAAAEGVIDVKRSVQVGLRTIGTTNGAPSDYGFDILTAPWVHRNGIDEALDVAIGLAGEGPVYLSFDIDGLDPAYAPGTGTPVPGGLSSHQALEFVRGLGGLNLVGMDIVEVSPAYDHSEITAIAAATIAHDFLCLLAEKKGAKRVPLGRL